MTRAGRATSAAVVDALVDADTHTVELSGRAVIRYRDVWRIDTVTGALSYWPPLFDSGAVGAPEHVWRQERDDRKVE